ncbi:hypothetical protein L202_04744 [Cryptococcus amylolentus CBS 6039]|uniref:Thioester reductase (TE) domain-containing protein n=2 Tax=Cryptococcus amylolentus TaxID=104669 RepID=A0A1E3HPE7_9TREE|nr:hypothetical protein L202_04744 [Cryptococcus amylolentus CBS 6039]ODN77576.1 hypothetical protein L202_04744 [Cryptococcus amylolentus CBS 6039]ODO05611.1 hypothetical protein I350_04670 [Cryptococcus amylolentus CBS 6273]
MPVTVLLTGLNGFVAVHTAVTFLSQGSKVIGTVRSEDKKAKTEKLSALEQYVANGTLSVLVVPDLAQVAWDWHSPGFRDVDAIAHIASPFDLTLPSYEKVAGPAINGTRNLLKAASKNPNIKSVAVLSSFAAAADAMKPITGHDGKVYTEADWLPFTEEDARQARNPGYWYMISKKYAELEAWKVVKETDAKWSFSTIVPPAAFGPPSQIGNLRDLKAGSGRDISTSYLFRTLGLGTATELPNEVTTRYIDVRDIAEAIYLTIIKRANGRYLIAGEDYTLKQILDTARKVRPDLEKYFNRARESAPPEASYVIDSSKSERELGLRYRTLEETIRDAVAGFERLGAYGGSIAEGYVVNGAKVYISSRDAAACEQTAKRLTNQGPGKCISLPGDLSKYDECVRLAKELEKRERVLHILVNNSGATWGESFHSYPDAAFTKLLTLNVQRVFTLTQQLHPLLEKAYEEDRFIARIINIGSINGVGNPGLETYAYSSSKAALHQLSKHLANRLAPHITVNAIAPGPFRSKMMKHTLDHFEKELAEGLPMKRIGAPEDIASTALWLSGPGGAWVTGTVVPVDGGSLVATSSKL